MSLKELVQKTLYHLTHYSTVSGAKLTVIEGAIKPRRAYRLDAGLDIAIQEDAIIPPGKTLYMPAGIKLDLPPHLAALVMTRSGTAKKDITVVPTIIDANYTDEISTIISNFTDRPIHIKRGDRYAQVVLIPALKFDNEEHQIETLSKDRPSNHKHGSSDMIKIENKEETL